MEAQTGVNQHQKIENRILINEHSVNYTETKGKEKTVIKQEKEFSISDQTGYTS